MYKGLRRYLGIRKRQHRISIPCTYIPHYIGHVKQLYGAVLKSGFYQVCYILLRAEC